MDTVITKYKERPLSRKPDEECQPMTLLVRKYYHNKKDYHERNKETLKAKAREKYATDPVYKEMCCKRRVKRVERVKTLKEFECEDADK
jgi:ribosomal protein L20A (L18A)